MIEAEMLIKLLTETSRTAVAAESCTGGLVADLLVQVPGASQAFWGSFVSYTGQAKTAMLGVPRDLLERYGPVSRETACAMARGALARSSADIGLAVTGLAGPAGDGTAVPVGTVWIASAVRGGQAVARQFFYPLPRMELRIAAAEDAVRELLARAAQH
ncbi:MAG: CinA family protein [Spirochaetaceae bacterium]|jgi:PncC family amidohydrolase|nr:CinA family protein [Spirochaetaceae bacterium]